MLQGLFAIFLATSNPAYEVLPLKDLQKKKQGNCTLVHVWATWCAPCIQELPGLLTYLGKKSNVRPLVIDISDSFVQNGFSKKWLASLKPSFVTYLKPEGMSDKYLKALDPQWPDRIPYTALFQKGKRVWILKEVGDFKTLDEKLTQACH